MQKISVITIVFNGEKYIETTIESVLAQNYQNLEYIIVDGGSTDNTLNIIRKYKDRIHKIVSEPDNGLADAMNKGVRLSTGDWIIHLHADDTFIDSNSLQKLMSVAKYSANNWITGYLSFQDQNNIIFKKDNFYAISWRGMLMRNLIRHQATVIKREAFNSISFSQNFKYAMDYYFFLNLWTNFGPPKVIKDHITAFRLDGNNLSSNLYASLIDEFRARVFFSGLFKTSNDLFIRSSGCFSKIFEDYVLSPTKV